MSRIAFLYSPSAFGTHRPPVDFDNPEAYSLTGTDLICVNPARELARRGHKVDLYCHAAGELRSYDGVTVFDWRNWGDKQADCYDVAIAISNPNALKHCSPSTVRLVNRQVSEFGIDCDDGWQNHVDFIMCPSRTACDVVSKPLDPVTQRKFRVLPNGCYPEQFGREQRVPGRVAYLSSPDRGLHWLLRCWPEIKRRVPEAHLRIYYYALRDWLEHRCQDMWRGTEEWRRAHYVKWALERLAPLGVEAVGGIPHGEIAGALSEATVMAYPCDPMQFTETYSVATLEACAAGCVPVICGADALTEVHGKACPTVAPPMRDRVGDFTDLVVRGLTDEVWRRSVQERGRAHAEAHAWPVLAERLERIIDEAREAKRPAAISLERPRFDLVLTEYAAGPQPIDLDDRMSESTSGGCREGFLGLVKAMGGRGYDVRAYSVFRRAVERVGVQYLPLSEYATAGKRDVLLAYYDTSPLINVPSGSCVRISSHHTFRPPAHAIEYTDVHVAPSQYTIDAMKPVYDQNVPWHVLPNAVADGMPKWAPVRGRVIYHTSVSRGLHHLLRMWPSIRAKVPDATLHVVGDVLPWVEQLKVYDTRQGHFARRVEARIETAREAGGFELLGRLPRRTLLRELSEASCFAFPCDVVGPTETFSVSVMECCAIGVPVVLQARDALGSIYKGAVRFAHVTGDFADAVVSVLTDENEAAVWSESGRALARGYTFANAAHELDRIVRLYLPAIGVVREAAE